MFVIPAEVLVGDPAAQDSGGNLQSTRTCDGFNGSVYLVGDIPTPLKNISQLG